MILHHDTPCRNVFPPTELLALETEALGQDHAAVQTVWAVAAYIAHQLLAPLMGFEPCGLLLLGSEAPRAIDWLGPLLHLHTLQSPPALVLHAKLIGRSEIAVSGTIGLELSNRAANAGIACEAC
jgi:hypothetical protein